MFRRDTPLPHLKVHTNGENTKTVLEMRSTRSNLGGERIHHEWSFFSSYEKTIRYRPSGN